MSVGCLSAGKGRGVEGRLVLAVAAYVRIWWIARRTGLFNRLPQRRPMTRPPSMASNRHRVCRWWPSISSLFFFLFSCACSNAGQRLAGRPRGWQHHCRRLWHVGVNLRRPAVRLTVVRQRRRSFGGGTICGTQPLWRPPARHKCRPPVCRAPPPMAGCLFFAPPPKSFLSFILPWRAAARLDETPKGRRSRVKQNTR